MIQNLLNLTEAQLAYMAGFVDADGSIGIISVSKTRRHIIRLSVSNTNQDAVSLFENSFGGKKRLRVWHGESKSNWKPCYEWSITTDKAARVIRILYPFLIIKKNQASLALRLDKLKKIICSGRCRWDADYNNRRIELYERLKRKSLVLNQRGLSAPNGSGCTRDQETRYSSESITQS